MSLFQDLLSSVYKQILKNKEVESQTAKAFNVFQILEITSDEVRLHSRFLAELLNPKGSHGQEALFLKLFLDEIGEIHLLENPEMASLQIEYHIDFKTDSTGGRIDILIQDQNRNVLIIENKIFAGDQENQLLRYYNYGKSLGTTFRIYYLNRFGDAPDEKSTSGLSTSFYSIISYKNTIANWLVKCEQCISHIPKLTVVILHYRQLIEYLTNQFYTQEMENRAIQEIIKDAASFEAAQLVEQSLLNARLELLRRFSLKLETELNKNTLVKKIFLNPEFGKKFHGMEIYINEENFSNENRSTHIRFSFLTNANDCYIEIHPGLIGNNANIDKHHPRLEYYEKELNGRFKSLGCKVENVKVNWHGDWVCRYNKFNNRYLDIIQNEDFLLEDVVKDLNFVINVFANTPK